MSMPSDSTTIDLDNVDLATVRARVVTTKGAMTFRFLPEAAPAHVRNFLTLAQSGFYDGTAFHRIIRNFMIQGGCPNTKEGATGRPGTGNPGHKVPAEFHDAPHHRGALSMARAQDPNSAGSQFFVVTAEHADFLDGQYTLFGNLVDGDDVLDAIADTPVDFGPGGERSQPTERVAIERVEFLIVEPEASDDDGGKQKPKPGEGADEAADGEGDADAPAGGEGDS